MLVDRIGTLSTGNAKPLVDLEHVARLVGERHGILEIAKHAILLREAASANAAEIRSDSAAADHLFQAAADHVVFHGRIRQGMFARESLQFLEDLRNAGIEAKLGTKLTQTGIGK